MKEQLLEILSNSKSNKHKYNISKYPEVYQWILDQTSTLSPGSSFLERIYCVLNNTHPICRSGNIKKFSENLRVGYLHCGRATSCICAKENLSTKLVDAKSKMSFQKVQNANNKRKNTNLELYGVEFNSQNPMVKEKKKETCIKKYGVTTNLQTVKNKEKSKDTLMLQYGVDSPMRSPKILKKAQDTNLVKYGNICNLQEKTLRDNIEERHLVEYGVKLFPKSIYSAEQIKLLTNKSLLEKEVKEIGILQTSKKYDLHIDRITFRLDAWDISYDRKFTSIENFIKVLLDKHNVEYIFRSRKIIAPYELDFVIPEKKLAIEVCGLHWHSEKYIDKNYHLMKLNKCINAGYRLITIFSDEIDQSPNIVISKLEYSLGKIATKIYARSCTLKELSAKETSHFLETYHIQGNTSASVRIGAYFDNELISVMTFNKNRKFTGDKTEYFELVRFATKGQVIGIASRLFKYFVKNYSPSKIISYADRRWSIGTLYEKLGFFLVKTSKPNYWYSKNMIFREHRYKYCKAVLVAQGYSKNKSESQIMLERNIFRIWDCGTMRFEWHK